MFYLKQKMLSRSFWIDQRNIAGCTGANGARHRFQALHFRLDGVLNFHGKVVAYEKQRLLPALSSYCIDERRFLIFRQEVRSGIESHKGKLACVLSSARKRRVNAGKNYANTVHTSDPPLCSCL